MARAVGYREATARATVESVSPVESDTRCRWKKREAAVVNGLCPVERERVDKDAGLTDAVCQRRVLWGVLAKLSKAGVKWGSCG